MRKSLNYYYKKIDPDFKEVLHKGTLAFVARVLGALSTFIATIYLARLLGVNNFGLFWLALTIITILSIFSRLGMDTLVLREVAKYENANTSGLARQITDSVFVIVLPISILLVSIILLFGDWVSEEIFSKPDISIPLNALTPFMLFLSLGFILGESFKGIRHTTMGVLLQHTAQPIIFLTLIYAASFFIDLDLKSSAWIYSTAGLITLVIFYTYWVNVTIQTKAPNMENNSRILIKKGFPLLLISSAGLLLAWTDIIVLGIFSTAKEVGIYTAVAKTALITSLILAAFNAIVAPKFSLHFTKGDIKGLERLAKKSTRLMAFLVFAPTIFLLFLPEWILGWFGLNFIEGANALMILVIGQFISVSCGSVGHMLVMTKNEKIVQNITIGTAISNVILSILLVEPFGMVGVAIATMVSMIAYNLISLYYVRQRLGFWMLG